jgi:hypothetical protein
MTEPSSTQNDTRRDTRQENWAAPVSRLNVAGVPDGAMNLNVTGRQVTTPMQGFGQMWQKTYRIRFNGTQVTPQEVVRVWRENFPSFWPKNNYFYGANGPIKPGDVAVLNLAGPVGITAPGGTPVISTGILVIYADEESFSFLTPQGHMFAAMNTFSAYEEDGVTYAQIQALIRASDPIYEISLRVGIGHKTEDDFWTATLKNLVAHFGGYGTPSLNRVCIDPKMQWSEAKNIWHNAAVRTTLYLIATPFRWAGRLLGGKKKPE